MDDILKTMRVSAAGMRAQGARLRIIAENMANADSLPQQPGGQPYRRRVVTFRSVFDRTVGADLVDVARISKDPTALPKRYEPGHPAADADGYVLYPNVNTLIEAADMREAQRTYEANLNAIKAAKAMLQDTIDVLR